MNNRPLLFFVVLCAATAFSPFLRAIESTTTISLLLPPSNVPAPAERLRTYTVEKGDTTASVAQMFGTSAKQLKKLNHLTKKNLKPGQMLKIPSTAVVSTASKTKASLAQEKKTKTGPSLHLTRHAQPVQDFNVPASTFASCPVPVPTEEIPPAPKPAVATPAPPVMAIASDNIPVAGTPARPAHPVKNGAPAQPPMISSLPPPQPIHRGLFSFLSSPPPMIDWGSRFIQLARQLGDRGLEYNEDWRPPGESRAITMDCSNTTRYLYRVATNIQLPRTASDQYYYLHLQNKAWDVPQLASGFADCNFLRRNLKAGDLLFWENTYRPERQPPITHVMIFLGTNGRGDWIMAGSQSSRGGEHNRRHGGPDIYVFNPTRPCGGYTTWMGLVHHQGRFCAYGRPLEADKSKLAVAAND